MNEPTIDQRRAALNEVVGPLFDEAREHFDKARVAVQPASFKLDSTDVLSALGHLEKCIELTLDAARAIHDADPALASQLEAATRLLARRETAAE